MKIEQILCGEDNIAALLHDEASSETIAIDAPDGEIMLQALRRQKRSLTAVLITHSHADHIAGIPLLQRKTNAAIYMPQQHDNCSSNEDMIIVKDKQKISIGAFHFIAMATPGHSLDSMSYYMPQEHMLFSGDTLFSLGCGRVFTNDMDMMFASLQKLAALPPQTQLYCGHEYSAANARFALTLDPHNKILQQRAAAIQNLRARHKITLPSALQQELEANPFLRCHSQTIRNALSCSADLPDKAVFAKLRLLKDNFS